MLQSDLSRLTLVFLSSTLTILSVSCSTDTQPTVTSSEKPSPEANLQAAQPVNKPTLPALNPPQKTPENEPNAFELALDRAAGASAISKSAQSPEDWNLVTSLFQDAIALMQKVPANSPNSSNAKKQISVYQQEIKLAKLKAKPSKEKPITNQTDSTEISASQPTTKIKFPSRLPVLPTSKGLPPKTVVETNPNTQVFIVPIKRRIFRRVPVVEVTFNGQQRFDMVFDTGASNTLITPEMASALKVRTVSKAKVDTASAKGVTVPVGYVDSIELGGLVLNQVPVAIASKKSIEVGLLGHDFFGRYEVTIKRDTIELRPQSS